MNTLKDLSDNLERLSKQPLPSDTRRLLQSARTQLDQLSQTSNSEKPESRLEALYLISQSLGLTLDLDDVLNQVMDAIIEITGAERGFLTLIDPSSGELEIQAARNIEGENINSENMAYSRTVIQSVIDSEKGIVTTDAQTDPRFAGQHSVVLHSLRSILCSPLLSSGKIIGVIYIENRVHTGIFTSDDLDLVNTFAIQAAVAIDNARLYTRTDQALAARLDELETLSLIDRELNAELGLVRASDITRRWVTKYTSAKECWIALSDADSGFLRLFAGPTREKYQAPDIANFSNVSNQTTPQEISVESTTYLVTPLVHADELQGAIVVVKDSEFQADEKKFLSRIAGRSAAAIANARLLQAVQQANESKSQFVSIVTHELRIPLTSIKGYTDLIRQGVVGEVNQQQMEFLEVIHSNVDRMTRLISDLSDISRIERGKLQLETAPLKLHVYINETFNSLRHKTEEKHQSLTAKIPDDLPEIHADPNRLVQVLTNLVSNAWKYTPRDGLIIVRSSQVGAFIRVEVIDNGIGISQEDQSRLFTQFFRSEAQEVREQNGWGLGLNVAQKLVELMGGEIGFNSTLEQGSNFWFTLPIAPK